VIYALLKELEKMIMQDKDKIEKLVHVRLSRLSKEPDLGVITFTTSSGMRKLSLDAMRAEQLLDEVLAYFDVPCSR
jgi:hypothetical protein